jgi:HSP20 family protein
MALPVRRNNNNDGGEVARWDPFDELDRLNRQLAGFLERWRQAPALLGGGFTPLADVEETPEGYNVEIELPGLRRDDIDIEIAGSRITVTGERKEKERAGILRRRERTVGHFTYDVALPSDIDEDRVRAQLNDGVLTVWAPKPERDRPRRIEVH